MFSSLRGRLLTVYSAVSLYLLALKKKKKFTIGGGDISLKVRQLFKQLHIRHRPECCHRSPK